MLYFVFAAVIHNFVSDSERIRVIPSNRVKEVMAKINDSTYPPREYTVITQLHRAAKNMRAGPLPGQVIPPFGQVLPSCASSAPILTQPSITMACGGIYLSQKQSSLTYGENRNLLFTISLKRRKNGISYFHLFFDQLERPNDVAFMFVYIAQSCTKVPSFRRKVAE